MVLAHAEGISKACEVFAIACDTAMNMYPDDDKVQFAYLSGLVQGLRRIATRTHKGFRT